MCDNGEIIADNSKNRKIKERGEEEKTLLLHGV